MSEVLSQSDKKKIYGQIEDLESKLYKLKKELQYYTEINNGDITRIKKKYNNMSAELSVSAEKIKAEVTKEVDGKLENYSTIEQTADSITATVEEKTKDLATKDDVSSAVSSAKSEIKQTTDSITATVTSVETDINGLKTVNESVFEQTSTGFKLKGDVAISGKLYDTDFEKGYFEVSSGNSATDFGFYSKSNKEIFKIYDAIDGFTLYGYGHNFLQGNANGVSPVGDWNFSGATVSGLNNITAVAVFG